MARRRRSQEAEASAEPVPEHVAGLCVVEDWLTEDEIRSAVSAPPLQGVTHTNPPDPFLSLMILAHRRQWDERRRLLGPPPWPGIPGNRPRWRNPPESYRSTPRRR